MTEGESVALIIGASGAPMEVRAAKPRNEIRIKKHLVIYFSVRPGVMYPAVVQGFADRLLHNL
jgi:hypothetical protein